MRPATLLALALALFLAGCGSVQYREQHGQPPVEETAAPTQRTAPLSAEEIKTLWTREANGYVLTFRADPQVPEAGEPVTLMLTLQKKRGSRLQPVSKASVGCRTHAPSLTGHVHFSTSRLACTEISPGVYRATAAFSKSGEWEADFNIVSPEGHSIGADFPIVVQPAK